LIWLLVGYRSVADSLYPSDQVAYLISGGLGALFVLFVGAAALLFADWRDGGHKLTRIAALRGGSGWPGSRPLRPAAAHDGAGTPGDAPGSHVARRWALGSAVLLLLSVAVVALGWVRAADALRVERAMDGLVIAAAGLGITLVVLAAVAIRLRLTLGRRMSMLFSGIVVADEEPDVFAEQFGVDLSELWTADGLRRFHRASCPALLGVHDHRRPVRPTDTGLEPCLLCDAEV
jgi:hypothetical protein